MRVPFALSLGLLSFICIWYIKWHRRLFWAPRIKGCVCSSKNKQNTSQFGLWLERQKACTTLWSFLQYMVQCSGNLRENMTKYNIICQLRFSYHGKRYRPKNESMHLFCASTVLFHNGSMLIVWNNIHTDVYLCAPNFEILKYNLSMFWQPNFKFS